ncbi:exodeoxyribonuclease, putative [Entamoeba dispar SAW760]|uniref:Exonuclease 1 n=1 Tax=Entamoeba dispar (strain ATCC PRA-260 / SAW760) TaxID=370354 RepID=B0E8D7_ENTDS|nr:exodeoxyribonuclease, putative [Entamoeba dispar SAW760]EDR29180.1 exodeoxyribonuclease, putative [Entamoeba dispar SAW760]|eukprot:EDR29180.1 exodeoxyribonuclease, putative [Entamoeba dispar SAW760]
MGITGLKSIVNTVCRKRTLKELKGIRVAIDGYAWLHRASASCSEELCENIPTNGLSSFCVKGALTLLNNEITPIFVFDGARLPSKITTENDRQQKRNENLKTARDTTINITERKRAYGQAVEILPWMASAVIQSLNEIGVESIVAPFEADPQLGYLCKIGYVDAIICEDSDLIVHGCKRILFKFNKFDETVEEFLSSDLDKTDFKGFTRNMLVYSCVLAGCDYCKNISKVGIKKAMKIIKSEPSISKALIKLIETHGAELDTKEKKIEYLTNVRNAIFTFNYAYVYNPVDQEVVNLNEVPEELSFMVDEILGIKPNKQIAQDIANGTVDPDTHKPFEQFIDLNLFEKAMSLSTTLTSYTTGSIKKFHQVEPSFNSYELDDLELFDIFEIIRNENHKTIRSRKSMLQKYDCEEDFNENENAGIVTMKQSRKRSKNQPKPILSMTNLNFKPNLKTSFPLTDEELQTIKPKRKIENSYISSDFDLFIPSFDMYYMINQLK